MSIKCENYSWVIEQRSALFVLISISGLWVRLLRFQRFNERSFPESSKLWDWFTEQHGTVWHFLFQLQLLWKLLNGKFLIYLPLLHLFRSEDEQISEAKDFWLKYWVVFAHYYLIEYFADCFVSWVPFYSEVLVWPLKAFPLYSVEIFDPCYDLPDYSFWRDESAWWSSSRFSGAQQITCGSNFWHHCVHQNFIQWWSRKTWNQPRCSSRNNNHSCWKSRCYSAAGWISFATFDEPCPELAASARNRFVVCKKNLFEK